jgi:hypothetical protein
MFGGDSLFYSRMIEISAKRIFRPKMVNSLICKQNEFLGHKIFYLVLKKNPKMVTSVPGDGFGLNMISIAGRQTRTLYSPATISVLVIHIFDMGLRLRLS